MILDTNALSAWWDGNPEAATIIASAQRLCIPVPALAEFRYGVLQSQQRGPIEGWMKRALASTEILPVTDETTQHYAKIRLALKQDGKPIPMNDLWIAAIVRQNRMPLLSRDVHFDVVDGLERLGW